MIKWFCDVCEKEIEPDEDCWPPSTPERTAGVYTCGAEAWNARVNAALNGVEP